MSKYNAHRTEIDGIVFDSKKEANRYCELKMMEKAHVISGLELQKRFELQESFKLNGKTIRAITYLADFVYFDEEKGQPIVEDVKGMRTDVYKIKKKLFESKYNIEIKEV